MEVSIRSRPVGREKPHYANLLYLQWRMLMSREHRPRGHVDIKHNPDKYAQFVKEQSLG